MKKHRDRVPTIYCNKIHTNGFNDDNNNTPHMVYCSNKIQSVLVVIVLLATAILTQTIYSPIQTIAQEENNEEPGIPQAMCIYKDQEYLLTPHIFNDGQKSSRIAFPQLPDNYAPQMTIQQGEQLTMDFDGDKEPTEIQALLVDYDADITETYPLKKINDNQFEITQTGIKTLEVIASFPDNEHISYTMLVDVRGEGENNY
ncbi:MAG TPA: hypothetical protein VE573_05780 [Nitrososphaeraceae archaeon]|nr:hypothetical protein [Nitrososphaeraceae archaeon]